MATERTGVWLVGARGSVATTVAVGLQALRQGDAATIGLVTETPLLAESDLPSWDQFVVGGHEVRSGTLGESARELEVAQVLPHGSAERYADELAEIDSRIRQGVLFRSGEAIQSMADNAGVALCENPRAAVDRITEDLRTFRETNQLDRVVVVLLGSTEPEVDANDLPKDAEALDAMLDEEACPLRASSLYAIGAAQADTAFVNFTPSLGASCDAINELFFRRGLPHAGSDGKTGETLLKSALAPMFAARNLAVDSWVGHNLLGNRDGAVLADPENKEAKLRSKQQLLDMLLGYAPQSHVSIENIESLGDWKTAWNHVHFRGFLGVPMTLQLTWQGCDSALAAPLVLDLARLMDLALRRGEAGAIEPLGAFFKSPLGDTSQAFADQTRALFDWVHNAPTDG